MSTPASPQEDPLTIVKAAISQTTWTGDKESMLDKHEQFSRDAAAQGAQVICFQELFYGPYFGITQDQKYYRFAEPVDGPIVQRFAALAKELGMVHVLPIYEEEQTGVYYNTAVVVDADGTVLGSYRKHHIPHLDQFWEKFYFRPGNLGYPVFDTAVGKVGVYICYDRHFPEGWRELGLDGAHMVFNPNATKPGLSNRLWEVEGPCAAVANGYFVLQPNRVGREDNEYGDDRRRLLRHQPGHRPARQLRRRARLGHRRGAARPRPRPRHGPGDARRLAVLPRPPPRLLHPASRRRRSTA